MSGAKSRNKGANFERLIAKDLTELTGFAFGRSLTQTRGGGTEAADICLKNGDDHKALDRLHFELKHHKKASATPAWKQATADCKVSGRVPIVITKSDREQPKVTMTQAQFYLFAQSWVHSQTNLLTDKTVTISYDLFKEMLLPWIETNS